LPDDGVERWLIRGELRENRATDTNRRRPDHGRTCARIVTALTNPRPLGRQTSRLPRGPLRFSK
jgi:hypothetical protein